MCSWIPSAHISKSYRSSYKPFVAVNYTSFALEKNRSAKPKTILHGSVGIFVCIGRDFNARKRFRSMKIQIAVLIDNGLQIRAVDFCCSESPSPSNNNNNNKKSRVSITRVELKKKYERNHEQLIEHAPWLVTKMKKKIENCTHTISRVGENHFVRRDIRGADAVKWRLR